MAFARDDSSDSGSYDKQEHQGGSHLLFTALPLVFFVLFFVANGVVGWLVLKGIESNQALLTNSQDNNYLIDELYLEILRAESGQRGYLLTELESYLEPYEQAINIIGLKLQELNERGFDQRQQERLAELNDLVGEKLIEMESTILAVSSNRDIEAIQEIYTHRGRNLMQDISDLIVVMESYERGQLAARSVRVANFRTTALVVQILSNLVGLVMVCLIYALVRKNHLAQQTRSEMENQAKTEFLANLSHEIRTPLTSIIGYTELLQGRHKNSDDTELTNRLAIINRNSVHLLSLLNDTLDLSKIEAGKIEIEKASMRLAPFLADLTSIATARAAENQLAFTFQQRSPLPERVVTDKTRLRQILLNLISNAIKFTRKGSVTLTAELITEVPSAKDNANGEAEPSVTKLKFDVIDTGRGIAKKDIEAIFQPFIQSEKDISAHIGTGLGLTISNSLAQLLGGEITVKSRLKHGSTFTLTVDPGDIAGQPLGELNLDNEVSAQRIKRIAGFKGKILVADDIEDIRHLVGAILDQAGIDCEFVSTGRDAMDKLCNPESPFSLVIMDINMPEMNGDETIRVLRDKGINTPAIALTAASLQGDRDRYLKAGFDGYVSKPISASKLLAEIKRIMANHGHEQAKSDAITTLVIEDNDDARNALCDMLAILGSRAVGAGCLAEAKQLVSRHPIELVLTDLHLGEENGLAIASELKAMAADLQIVVISGDSSILDKENAIPPEINAVLIKPVTADAIRRLLEG